MNWESFNKYNSIDTDATYKVDRMELIQLADQNNNYTVSPAWLLDMVLNDSGSSPYSFQIAMDAQTGNYIAQ